MADCRIVNASAEAAVGEIAEISESFRTAGDEFMGTLANAIAPMEGEAKDALKRFFDTTVRNYVVDQLPSAITGMSELLEGNRENFVNVDKSLADSIGG